MNKEQLRFQILQTLIRGKNVIIKDNNIYTPQKSHYLGKMYCDNLNIINNYIEQLNEENIISMIQEDEYSDLYIEIKDKLKFLWEVEE